MIFWSYILGGLILAVITQATLPGRFKKPADVLAKSDHLNTITIFHTLVYLLLTIFIIVRIPLPFYAFHQYLFADPLAIYEVLIAVVVFLLAAIYGRGYIRNLLQKGEVRPNSLELFYGSFNLLMVIVVFAFFSNNLALFWILLELTTILSAFLIVMLNTRDNVNAALKYVFIASTAMLFSVIGMIILFAMTQQATGSGTLSWNELMQNAGSLQPSLFIFAFTFIFIGFASKAGIAPFHTWLPQAHARAPSMVSAVLSAVLLNGGIYGILRLLAVAHRTEAWHTISIIMVVFGTITIAIAALSMLPRSNLKKLIGFSSIEHMGLVLTGLGIGTPVAVFWTLFHILSHSLIKSLLFFSAGILHQQFDSNRLTDMQNALKLQPLASWGIIIGSLAVVGFPPFPIFFSKLFILIQLGGFSLPVLFITLILLLIVAAAFSYLLIRALSQSGQNYVKSYPIQRSMKVPIVILFIIITLLGFSLSWGISDFLTSITASLGF